MDKLRPALALPLGFMAGAVPFSNLMARRAKGVDLRTVRTGTVSGSSLYEVAGFWALAAAGVLEVAKGAVGPVLAGRRHPLAAAVSAGAAVAGHNWSPFLRGAGGRGISPALGALGVTAPAGAVTLLAGMTAGRLAGETAVGSLIADIALVPIVGKYHGRQGCRAAWAVLVPLVLKRLAGNARPQKRGASVYLSRLLFDRDTRQKALGAQRQTGERAQETGR